MVFMVGGRQVGGPMVAKEPFAPKLYASRRCYAYAASTCPKCRDHLAGQLADELYRHFITKGWLRQGRGRAFEVTATGHRDLLPCLSESAV
jgi:hypothetical protein